MNPRRKKRLVIFSGLIGGAVLVVGFILMALSQNIDLFYTPTEILQGKKDSGVKPSVGQRIRVGGLVVAGTVERNDETFDVSFKLMDVGPTITVHYKGLLPDLFREGQGIVANGTLISPNEVRASEVLAKHDENYMPKEVADSLKEYDPERYKQLKSANPQ